MPIGRKINDNVKLKEFVDAMLREGFTYEEIIKLVKKEFDMDIGLALLSRYVKNYLPIEVRIFRKKGYGLKGSSGALEEGKGGLSLLKEKGYEKEIKIMKQRMKEVATRSSGEWLLDGSNVLNFYASRLSRLEILLDKMLLKNKLTDIEMRTFTSLMALQYKIYQQVLSLFSENKGREEKIALVKEMASLVAEVFLQEIKKEEKVLYHEKVKKLKKGLRVIIDKYIGKEVKGL